jgi:cbb3-type cytochrome oxidase maturation protein
MNVLLFMLPAALALALAGIAAFAWALRSGQFEDPKGDASRILGPDDRPV